MSGRWPKVGPPAAGRQTGASDRGPAGTPSPERGPARAASSRHRPRSPHRVLLVGLLVLLLAGGLLVLVASPGKRPLSPWARLGTEDVHALVFLPDDSEGLLFGHHGGILASLDGGRSWEPLASGFDAMSLGLSRDGSIVVAGHEVFAVSRDGGRTWQDIPADLPSLDIHGFARDPGHPDRMWAYLATGGFWESVDGGYRWQQVDEANVVLPVAVRSPDGPRLFGLTADGLVTSADGGRSWDRRATPALYPMASLAASDDGAVLVAGGPSGLARSSDGGRTWFELPFAGQPAAVAVAGSGRTVAVVTRTTELFRSDDGGSTWPGP